MPQNQLAILNRPGWAEYQQPLKCPIPLSVCLSGAAPDRPIYVCFSDAFEGVRGAAGACRGEQLPVHGPVFQQRWRGDVFPALDDATLPSGVGLFTLTYVTEVKKRRRGTSKISSKHQITIPAEALRSAGLEIGDRLVARSDGAGRVILEREHDVVAELAGALTGVYRQDELDELRSEWD